MIIKRACIGVSLRRWKTLCTRTCIDRKIAVLKPWRKDSWILPRHEACFTLVYVVSDAPREKIIDQLERCDEYLNHNIHLSKIIIKYFVHPASIFQRQISSTIISKLVALYQITVPLKSTVSKFCSFSVPGRRKADKKLLARGNTVTLTPQFVSPANVVAMDREWNWKLNAKQQELRFWRNCRGKNRSIGLLTCDSNLHVPLATR